MAVDMFLEIAGIKGEAKDKVHKGKIDILAWSWGLSNSGSGHTGGGSGAGKVNVQDISVTKYVDLSTAELLNSVTTGKHFKDAKLYVRKAGGDAPLEYITITMTDVFISSYSTGGSGGEDRITENVSINFSKYEVYYKEQTEKGTAGGDGKFGWNIKENVKV